MARTKIADLRQKTEKELEDRLATLRKEKFNLRFQQATGQLQNTARYNYVKVEIAQIETLRTQRRAAEKQGE